MIGKITKLKINLIISWGIVNPPTNFIYRLNIFRLYIIKCLKLSNMVIIYNIIYNGV